MQEVDKYNYLGVMISMDGGMGDEEKTKDRGIKTLFPRATYTEVTEVKSSKAS